MKLDRSTNGDNHGKYGLINNRRLLEILAWDGGEGEALDRQAVEDAVALLERLRVLDWGSPGTASEFFVVKLRDRFAGVTLDSYAHAARMVDREYAAGVQDLADRAGPHSKFCKLPD